MEKPDRSRNVDLRHGMPVTMIEAPAGNTGESRPQYRKLPMNQSLNCQSLPGTSDPTAQTADTFAFADTHTPLDRLICLLSDSTSATLADTGIVRFSRDRLDALSGNAQEESEACLDRAFLLLRLMEHTLENGCPPNSSELTTMAQHITHLLQDHQRWHTLADNAAYYRDHPQVAAHIAAMHTCQNGAPAHA
jgi:hypothetical protein